MVYASRAESVVTSETSSSFKLAAFELDLTFLTVNDLAGFPTALDFPAFFSAPLSLRFGEMVGLADDATVGLADGASVGLDGAAVGLADDAAVTGVLTAQMSWSCVTATSTNNAIHKELFKLAMLSLYYYCITQAGPGSPSRDY